MKSRHDRWREGLRGSESGLQRYDEHCAWPGCKMEDSKAKITVKVIHGKGKLDEGGNGDGEGFW